MLLIPRFSYGLTSSYTVQASICRVYNQRVLHRGATVGTATSAAAGRDSCRYYSCMYYWEANGEFKLLTRYNYVKLSSIYNLTYLLHNVPTGIIWRVKQKCSYCTTSFLQLHSSLWRSWNRVQSSSSLLERVAFFQTGVESDELFCLRNAVGIFYIF